MSDNGPQESPSLSKKRRMLAHQVIHDEGQAVSAIDQSSGSSAAEVGDDTAVQPQDSSFMQNWTTVTETRSAAFESDEVEISNRDNRKQNSR